jgi:glycine hydroxymethyltransferase
MVSPAPWRAFHRSSLAEVDPTAAAIIDREIARQEGNLELIASENIASSAVREAVGSVFTDKYAEGYPGRRYYGGCEHADEIEQLALDRLREIYGAPFANVQPHSGAQANMAVFHAFLRPGDRIMGLGLSDGGHLTHGSPVAFSGQMYEVSAYGLKDDETIDYDGLRRMALETRPKMIISGASAYSRVIDFEYIGKVAQEVGALHLSDIAHYSGLIAGGEYPNPVPHADFVTSTTHKSLRGPRGGFILYKNEEHDKAIRMSVFPGLQGGPLMHVIAGKAVAFGLCLRPDFKLYAAQVKANAKALASAMAEKGFRIVSGGTDSHLMLVDLRPFAVNGRDAQTALDEAGITTNRNSIPNDPEKPFVTSGLRLGTPAVTTRGMAEPEMAQIADLITRAIQARHDAEKLAEIRVEVRALCGRYPTHTE